MFDYLIDKIEAAGFESIPFRHVHIDNFLSDTHFTKVATAAEIAVAPQKDDATLIDTLIGTGYGIVSFPGCLADRQTYIDWHRDRSHALDMHSACAGMGMAFRLMNPRTGIIKALDVFLKSAAFNNALARKFSLESTKRTIDCGIQKYLDGYEISPHPDIRQKALTYMVNINPGAGSDSQAYHTHFLALKPAYRYIQAFWEGNVDCQRCWLPWDWCETVKMQTSNNSITILMPGDDTLHGVKATYDHLPAQRTQIYGNHWFTGGPALHLVEWEDLDVKTRADQQQAARQMHRLLERMQIDQADDAVIVNRRKR